MGVCIMHARGSSTVIQCLFLFFSFLFFFEKIEKMVHNMRFALNLSTDMTVGSSCMHARHLSRIDGLSMARGMHASTRLAPQKPLIKEPQRIKCTGQNDVPHTQQWRVEHGSGTAVPSGMCMHASHSCLNPHGSRHPHDRHPLFVIITSLNQLRTRPRCLLLPFPYLCFISRLHVTNST
jgi:hypothetical protein